MGRQWPTRCVKFLEAQKIKAKTFNFRPKTSRQAQKAVMQCMVNWKFPSFILKVYRSFFVFDEKHNHWPWLNMEIPFCNRETVSLKWEMALSIVYDLFGHIKQVRKSYCLSLQNKRNWHLYLIITYMFLWEHARFVVKMLESASGWLSAEVRNRNNSTCTYRQFLSSYTFTSNL